MHLLVSLTFADLLHFSLLLEASTYSLSMGVVIYSAESIDGNFTISFFENSLCKLVISL